MISWVGGYRMVYYKGGIYGYRAKEGAGNAIR